MSRTLFNTHEALQMLEDEGFFTEADIIFQPSEDGMESEEDSRGENGNNANHLSSAQLLAEADVRIEYGHGRTLNTLEENQMRMKR